MHLSTGRQLWLLSIAIGCAMLARGVVATASEQSPDPRRFEMEIAAFEAEDRAASPAPGGTLFVGSSSIRYWNLLDAFPGRQLIKRGFGGSHVSDNIHYADRIIFPYQPALIVFYAGDADVAGKKSAEEIAADCQTLIARIHARLPRTQMVIIGTKPSPAHWAHIETIRKANALVRALIASDPLVAYADVDQALVGPDGRPRADFYAENGLNLNERGYAAWNDAVRPVIEKHWPR